MATTLRAPGRWIEGLGWCLGLGMLGWLAHGCFLQVDSRQSAHGAAVHHHGGTGGEAGNGGAGGTGGGSVDPCLPDSDYDDVFAIELPELCLVAKYTAPIEVGFALSPTWGRHGGPITATYEGAPTDLATITRWKLPAGTTGALEPEATGVSLGITASPVFFGAQAVNLPFLGWTMLSWTGSSTDGEALFVHDGVVAARHPVVGMFGALGLAGPSCNRLLHTSLGALDDVSSPALPSLYAADFCPGPGVFSHVTVATWGDANGPVTADQSGNVFALETSSVDGDQTLRGFAASTVAPGTATTSGNELFTMAGFGSQLAALAPSEVAPGLALLQPVDSLSWAALDVMAQLYTVASANIVPTGSPIAALSMVVDDTPVTLLSDPHGRLWVGVVGPAQVTTFYVLERRVLVPL